MKYFSKDEKSILDNLKNLTTTEKIETLIETTEEQGREKPKKLLLNVMGKTENRRNPIGSKRGIYYWQALHVVTHMPTFTNSQYITNLLRLLVRECFPKTLSYQKRER